MDPGGRDDRRVYLSDPVIGSLITEHELMTIMR